MLNFWYKKTGKNTDESFTTNLITILKQQNLAHFASTEINLMLPKYQYSIDSIQSNEIQCNTSKHIGYFNFCFYDEIQQTYRLL